MYQKLLKGQTRNTFLSGEVGKPGSMPEIANNDRVQTLSNLLNELQEIRGLIADQQKAA